MASFERYVFLFCLLCPYNYRRQGGLLSSLFLCWPDYKPEGPLFSAEWVCVCVCLCVSDRHFYPSTWTDFNQTWSQGPCFGRDPNGPDRPQRDRATPFLNFKKNLKNHRIRISKFWSIIFLRLCLLCIVKNSTRFEHNWRRRYILKFAIPATTRGSNGMRSLVLQCTDVTDRQIDRQDRTGQTWQTTVW